MNKNIRNIKRSVHFFVLSLFLLAYNEVLVICFNNKKTIKVICSKTICANHQRQNYFSVDYKW